MAGLLFCDVGPRQRERKFRAGTQSDIDDYSDEELRVRYRFRRESILFITNLVAGDISRNTRRNHALPPLLQVLIALRFYASGSFLQVIGDTFSVDKSTVSRAITDVSRAVIAKQHLFIKWPLTNDECTTIKNEFYLRGGFPCVIGCFDGTHVRLQAPSKHENNYVNRKGFHSINVQGVCNHEGE
ncbi:putative nuclease HARBI1 [Montipora capricornis]|uniref:putative nuclease HARBI1 n=1 Tax=Montipora capricornis TaxID=246305 RepID=UPI0035F1E6A3